MKITQETLVAPLSAPHPCGVSVREADSASHLYHDCKDARHQARLMERQLLGDPSLAEPTAEWQQVLKQGLKLLETESKDLEVCAWLVEAATRLHGFAGIATSYNLIADLLETHGEQLHPQPDPEDPELRFAALGGLNGFGQPGSLILPITKITLCNSDEGPFAFWQYQKAQSNQRLSNTRQREAAEAELGYTITDIEKHFKRMGKSKAQALQANIQHAIDAYKRFSQCIDQVDAAYAPPTSNILETLQDCQQHVHYLQTACQFVTPVEQATATVTESQSEADSDVTESVSTVPLNQNPLTRQSALKQIAIVADYFTATEPHSPIAYLLKRAVRWGELSLPELLQELIDDPNALQSVCGLTGIELQENHDV